MSTTTTDSKYHLVVQTAFLGDVILGIPFLNAIRSRFPDHRLALVCRRGVGDFFIKLGLVDECFEINKGDSDSYSQALQKISLLNIDVVFCPHESLRSARFCFQIKAQKKVAFKKFWNFLFFNERISKTKSWPEPLRQLSLLSPWIDSLSWKDRTDFYQLDENFRLSAVPKGTEFALKEKLLQDQKAWNQLVEKNPALRDEQRRRICLFPGSVWATKRWTEEGFVDLAQSLSRQNYQVFICGSKEESELCERISQKCPKATNLCGRTSIYESALLLARSQAMIGNDSASTHLATLAAIPTITIFGPTILEFGYRPWSNQAYILEAQSLSCRPCGPHGHHQCPLGTHECMKKISSQNVQKIFQHIINQ